MAAGKKRHAYTFCGTYDSHHESQTVELSGNTSDSDLTTPHFLPTTVQHRVQHRVGVATLTFLNYSTPFPSLSHRRRSSLHRPGRNTDDGTGWAFYLTGSPRPSGQRMGARFLCILGFSPLFSVLSLRTRLRLDCRGKTSLSISPISSAIFRPHATLPLGLFFPGVDVSRLSQAEG